MSNGQFFLRNTTKKLKNYQWEKKTRQRCFTYSIRDTELDTPGDGKLTDKLQTKHSGLICILAENEDK